MKRIAVLALFVLALVLGACYPVPASAPAFPVGKFTRLGSESEALQFNKDGTFVALFGDTHMAEGTYSAKDGVYTEESDNQYCLTPMHYKYTFDGSKLVFHPVEDPAADSCDGRKAGFNEAVTWIMAK